MTVNISSFHRICSLKYSNNKKLTIAFLEWHVDKISGCSKHSRASFSGHIVGLSSDYKSAFALAKTSWMILLLLDPQTECFT
jgi:hypothetical protein